MQWQNANKKKTKKKHTNQQTRPHKPKRNKQNPQYFKNMKEGGNLQVL